jgi:hypothetical protein
MRTTGRLPVASLLNVTVLQAISQDAFWWGFAAGGLFVAINAIVSLLWQAYQLRADRGM